MNVLVINAGSSSLKFQVIATDLDQVRNDKDELLCRGEVDRIGGEAIITVQSHTGLRQKLTAPIRDISAALDYVVRWLGSDGSGVGEIREISEIFAPLDTVWCMVASCSGNRSLSVTRSSKELKSASIWPLSTIRTT